MHVVKEMFSETEPRRCYEFSALVRLLEGVKKYGGRNEPYKLTASTVFLKDDGAYVANYEIDPQGKLFFIRDCSDNLFLVRKKLSDGRSANKKIVKLSGMNMLNFYDTVTDFDRDAVFEYNGVCYTHKDIMHSITRVLARNRYMDNDLDNLLWMCNDTPLDEWQKVFGD